ncbi:CAAX prenyl protease 2 [Melia azedarach]|uniref:CAAX prenyl protease 2 n=1 Tax=Melia azedarach TaxID=155640 RepID=A0ACC1X2Q9_MELAZ|nr:CAAX prenyl protease 2 [Melia azedarach]
MRLKALSAFFGTRNRISLGRLFNTIQSSPFFSSSPAPSISRVSGSKLLPNMEQETEATVSKAVAAIACASMALFYVAILYAPTLILRLPPPSSLKHYLIRRFICAAISSIVSLIFSAFILSIRSKEASNISSVYGIRGDHMWQAVVFPLFLTSLMYAGSLVLKFLLLVNSRTTNLSNGGRLSFDFIKSVPQIFLGQIFSITFNVLAWRTYVVAPLTEELVFRACMIPLLLCGGFKIYTVIFLCPIFFSLAHLNHLMEIYSSQNFSVLKASMIVGLQLGYTVVFGWYASFLFIRTGHLVAPLVAHAFCNYMGLPVLFARRRGLVSVAFVAGMVGFVRILFPITRPDLYNDRTNNCRCWHGYCSWN